MMAVPSGHSFATCYIEQCRQQRLRPLPVICVTLPNSLDFTTDRVKMDDWGPILNSLSLDRTLRSISVRSRYQHRRPLEEINSEEKARAIGKAPVFPTRFVLDWLSQSINQCVRYSPTLTVLELEGIPIPPDCLAVLSVGLSATQSLQHLSFQRCYIGDTGCDIICRAIVDVRTIKSLNLAQCELTPGSGPGLAAALSRQKLSLYHDAWKQSLRYREPNLEAMPGLRRLTLNGNSRLGDKAVKEIIDAIRDSLWLKALDLQDCGLSEGIGTEILEVLNYNKTLAIVDVRRNVSLRDEVALEIARKLELNHGNRKSEYQWLNLPQNKRITAVVNMKKNKQDETNKAMTRSNMVSNRQSKRHCQVPSRVIQPTTYISKRIKTKPPIPPFVRHQRDVPEQPRLKENVHVKSLPKASLHLDLQAQIRSDADSTRNEETLPEERVEVKSIVQAVNHEDDLNAAKIKDAIFQLTEMRAEREQLMEEVKRTDLLLTEERARREIAEAKLHSSKCDFAELEEAVREKEREADGFVLVSHKSLDEISLSFDRLLDMLDSASRQPSLARVNSEEEFIVREDIRQRIALILRKTKSENVRRGHFVEEDEISPRVTNPKRFARKSEGDIRSILPPLIPIHFERHIGDSPELTSPTLEPSYRERFEDPRPRNSKSAGERARAIFSQIVNGEAILNLSTHVG